MGAEKREGDQRGEQAEGGSRKEGLERFFGGVGQEEGADGGWRRRWGVEEGSVTGGRGRGEGEGGGR